jgi:hypothetical protein
VTDPRWTVKLFTQKVLVLTDVALFQETVHISWRIVFFLESEMFSFKAGFVCCPHFR